MRFNVILLLAIVFVIGFGTCSYAGSHDLKIKNDTLIDGCAAYLEFEESKGSSFNIILRLSHADALRAGICAGVLYEYRRKHSCRNSVSEQARKISISSPIISYRKLLKESCR